MVRNVRNSRFNYSFLLWFVFVTFTFQIFCIFNAPNASAATQVSLEWNANSETDLAGYRIFCREQSQSYDYLNPSWEGTDTTCTISDLDETKTYCFVARAFNSEEVESQDSIELCQKASAVPNLSPTADAGPDQTVSQGHSVVLNGANSTDADDGIASYRWAQTGGPAVTLSNPSATRPTFTSPDVTQAGATLTFELTVVDRGGNQAKDVCVVNVTWENEPPQANAGLDQTVEEGSAVTLDGSSSLDIDDGLAGYRWTQTGGPTVTLLNRTSSKATFAAPNVGPDGVSLSFNLTVTDADGLQNTDACIVNVSWQNEPPRAVVTPDYMETDGGALVTLDGSGSTDPDDGITSYLWTQVSGDPVSLSDPTSAVAKFVAPKTGSLGKNLNFRLTVKDRGGLQSTADSTVYVNPNTRQNTPLNNPPVADFSYNVNSQTAAFTDLSGDTDGTIASWSWNFGDGSTSTHKNPGHRYRKDGTYTVTLTVIDNGGASNSHSKTVTISTRTKRSSSRLRWRWR
ncbi:MAG: PKD domain-containing protein [Desulfobacterales bacterium]